MTLPFKSANVSDYVEFGNYSQSSNGDIQPIEWQVLAIEENKILVISKYCLEARRFDTTSNNWKNSEIRQWLNNDFYNKSFNEKDKKHITSFEGDNIFLLSLEEANKYFANNKARKCKATEYAVNNGAYVDSNGCSYWWLRTPSSNPNYTDIVFFVYRHGSFGNRYVYINKYVVRPSLWINL